VASVVFKRFDYRDSAQTYYFYNTGKLDSSITYELAHVDSVDSPNEEPFGKVWEVTRAASYSFTGENVTAVKNYYRGASGFRLVSQVSLSYDKNPIIPDPRVIMPMSANNVVEMVVIYGDGWQSRYSTQYQYNDEGYPSKALRYWSQDPVTQYHYTCAPRKKL
jgi:hypothetical protein